MIEAITKLQLGRIEKRIRDNHNLPFSYDDDVIKLITSRCTEMESGGRMIDAILTNTMLPAISAELLGRMVEGQVMSKIHISVSADEFSYRFD
jgi:type VI secretion system protein VasG